MTSFDQLVAEIRALQAHDLQSWIDARWVQPVDDPDGPVFRAVDVARVRLIADVKYEFEVSDEVLPLLLSLVDQSHDLRNRLQLLADAINAQPETVRTEINRALAGKLQGRSRHR